MISDGSRPRDGAEAVAREPEAEERGPHGLERERERRPRGARAAAAPTSGRGSASAEAKTPVTSSAPQTVHPRGTSTWPAATATTVNPPKAASISASVIASASYRGATRSISTIWSE